MHSGGVDGEGRYDGEDGDGKTDGENERGGRDKQRLKLRVRRRAHSGTSHRLDTRAWLFHALHNTRIGSVTTSAEIVR